MRFPRGKDAMNGDGDRSSSFILFQMQIQIELNSAYFQQPLKHHG